jgi:hypothetical protein
MPVSRWQGDFNSPILEEPLPFVKPVDLVIESAPLHW